MVLFTLPSLPFLVDLNDPFLDGSLVFNLDASGRVGIDNHSVISHCFLSKKQVTYKLINGLLKLVHLLKQQIKLTGFQALPKREQINTAKEVRLLREFRILHTTSEDHNLTVHLLDRSRQPVLGGSSEHTTDDKKRNKVAFVQHVVAFRKEISRGHHTDRCTRKAARSPERLPNGR